MRDEPPESTPTILLDREHREIDSTLDNFLCAILSSLELVPGVGIVHHRSFELPPHFSRPAETCHRKWEEVASRVRSHRKPAVGVRWWLANSLR